MRGDSRRDLYAKALALMGLGVLAGTGAVVDYWPVGVRHPQIFAAFERATLGVPGPIALPDIAAVVDVAQPASADVAVPSGVRPTVQRTRQAALVATPAPTSYPSLPATAGPVALGAPVDLRPLPPPAFVVARNDMSSLGSKVELDQVMAPPSTVRADQVAAFAAPAGRDGDGFFADAFKRTGTSILRTGAKTGTSLAGAVRVVGSVVRRALPNKN